MSRLEVTKGETDRGTRDSLRLAANMMDIHTWLEAIGRNLKYGVRTLAKTPVFTMTVILTLALGIGANSAVFSAIYAVLLRPLPFPDSDRLMKLAQSHPKIPLRLFSRLRFAFHL